MVYEYEGKTEKEAIEKAATELGLERDQFDVEILEAQKNSLFKKGFVKIRVHIEDNVNTSVSKSAIAGTKKIANPVPQGEFEEKLTTFIKEVIEKMGYDVKVDVMFREEKKIGIKLESSSSSILIGRKGKNLDALQLLLNVYAGKLGHEEVRVILDTENYRIRREESLVRLAYTTADKVRSSKNSILLEPMNPFERRLIHTTLNDIPDIETKSEGDGLYKQVRVIYKGLV
ncbi:MAG: protein jag [Treponema sp.]|uniref:RNA-binding cell elongation regulator Jag/EloR n=2 Tax=Treponema sp. TaxID=166 RepID=UPI001D74C5BD|nr:RNA-binding cell elongation regulator Jag/EloR [Treponema sp.]MBS7311394.1 protein jag [Treponema sp.]MCI5695809.1 protein jag [Spirochaetia bacterium]MDD5811540.1 protein jag [Treponema sp.]MDY5885584.1 RNA-binding cell elongation regulator Jag/EloR [Treponema sp.]